MVVQRNYLFKTTTYSNFEKNVKIYKTYIITSLNYPFQYNTITKQKSIKVYHVLGKKEIHTSCIGWLLKSTILSKKSTILLKKSTILLKKSTILLKKSTLLLRKSTILLKTKMHTPFITIDIQCFLLFQNTVASNALIRR